MRGRPGWASPLESWKRGADRLLRRPAPAVPHWHPEQQLRGGAGAPVRAVPFRRAGLPRRRRAVRGRCGRARHPGGAVHRHRTSHRRPRRDSHGRVMSRLRKRAEWQFFTVLPKADRRLATLWWAVLIARGVLPAGFAIATGVLVSAVQAGRGLVGPLVLTGVVFVALQVLSPIHTAVSNNLGDRTAAWLNDRLAATCVAPPGLGHLEDHELTADLTVARDFDLGMTGPPLFI